MAFEARFLRDVFARDKQGDRLPVLQFGSGVESAYALVDGVDTRTQQMYDDVLVKLRSKDYGKWFTGQLTGDGLLVRLNEDGQYQDQMTKTLGLKEEMPVFSDVVSVVTLGEDTPEDTFFAETVSDGQTRFVRLEAGHETLERDELLAVLNTDLNYETDRRTALGPTPAFDEAERIRAQTPEMTDEALDAMAQDLGAVDFSREADRVALEEGLQAQAEAVLSDKPSRKRALASGRERTSPLLEL